MERKKKDEYHGKSDPEEEKEFRKTIQTPQFDPRFPNTNQTLNCFVNYVDYHRCLDLLGEKNETKCDVFKKIFTSLCPNDWVAHWDEMRDIGTFPHPIVRVPDPSK